MRVRDVVAVGTTLVSVVATGNLVVGVGAAALLRVLEPGRGRRQAK